MMYFDFIYENLPLILNDKSITMITQVENKLKTNTLLNELFTITTENHSQYKLLILKFHDSNAVWGAFLFDKTKLRFFSLEISEEQSYFFCEATLQKHICINPSIDKIPSKDEFINLILDHLNGRNKFFDFIFED